MKKIIIIGAGPTGLSTAHSLSEKTKYDIKVFDAGSRVGGLAGSGEIDGMISFRTRRYYKILER